MADPVFESKAELLKAVPVTLVSTPGTLRLDTNRLTFTKRRGSVLVDLPVGSLHSVAKSAVGVTVWSGPDRYRFSIGDHNAAVHAQGLLGAAIAASQMPGELADYRRGRELAAQWVEVLQRVAATGPPDGVEVRPPWPLWAWIATVTGMTMVVFAMIFAIVFAAAR